MKSGLFKRFLKATAGTFAIELAFVTPVLTGLLLGGVEVSRFVLLNQKIERTSATLADLVSQAEILTEADLANLFEASVNVMSPFSLDVVGQAIVTSVSATGGDPAIVRWQRVYGVQGSPSAVGVEGAEAQLPPPFFVRDGESIIVTEVYYSFTPFILTGLIEPKVLYNLALLRPRYGRLTSIN